MFMKIDSQLSNSNTHSNLGYQALYLIAMLPSEERDKPQQLNSGETKTPYSTREDYLKFGG